MATWLDRQRGNLVLTSPKGTSFYAMWSENVREGTRKVSVWDYPLTDEQTIQDLGTGLFRIPIDFMFEGEQHDLIASDFVTACKEPGVWTLAHPTRGDFEAYLLTFRENLNTSNITGFETEWVSKSDKNDTIPVVERQSKVVSSVAEMDESILEKFQRLLQDTAERKDAIVSKITSGINFAMDKLGTLYSATSEVYQQALEIQSGVVSYLAGSYLDLGGIAASVQSFFQLPALVEKDLSIRVTAYQNLLLSVCDLSIDPEDDTLRIIDPVVIVNSSVTQNLLFTSVLGSMMLAFISGDIVSRRRAYDYIDGLNADVTTILSELDKAQEYLSDENIPGQYFSQDEVYPVVWRSVGDTVRYIADVANSLKVEKRIVMEKPRTTLDVTITEYEDAELLDYFIESNSLTGVEVMLLPPGREVLLYV